MKTAEEFLKDRDIKDTLWHDSKWIGGGLSALLNEYHAQFKEPVTDEAIEEVAKQVGFDQLDDELTNYELMQYKLGYIDGAKAYRDGLIFASGNVVKDEKILNCVESFIRSNHLSKEWDKFRDEWFSSAPDIKQGKEDKCNNFRGNPFSENEWKCLNCGKMKSEHK